MDAGADGSRRGHVRAESVERFKSGSLAARELGIHGSTLRRYANEGRIRTFRTPGGHRRYDTSELISSAAEAHESVVAKDICYCRVSTQKQKDDLERQVQSMRDLFPGHDVVTDIGSGINFKRRGLQGILERSMRGEVGDVVVAYRDRLCRFAFELVDWIVRSNGGKVVVLNGEVGSLESELAEDLMSIVHVFSARSYGHRKYGKKKKIQKGDGGNEGGETAEASCGGDEDGAYASFQGYGDAPEALDGML
jgi:predicted site-specific integrase-resolvase